MAQWANPSDEALACLDSDNILDISQLNLKGAALKAVTDIGPIGRICENPQKDVEQKFHEAIVTLTDRKNGDLIWGPGVELERLYQAYPKVFAQHASSIGCPIKIHRNKEHQPGSNLLAATYCESYFISLIDEDQKLKKFAAIQAVVRVRELDGNYYFRPAILSSADGTKAYSAEMCFYSPTFYGNAGAIQGRIHKDCEEATVYLLGALRHFPPFQKGDKRLKQQLVTDCCNMLVTFAKWAITLQETLAEKGFALKKDEAKTNE